MSFLIDTSDIEEWATLDRDRFLAIRSQFIAQIRQIVDELSISDKIDHLSICGPHRERSEIWRDEAWPSRTLFLSLYTAESKYMDEKLIRHEFGHEADRHNPSMLYDTEIERRWRGANNDIFNLIVNISLDSRLGALGLGKSYRKLEFESVRDKNSSCFDGKDDFFDRTWRNPPVTWPDMEELAKSLVASRPHQD